MAETEKWFGYATRKDGAVKRVEADVPVGEKAYDHIAPLIPADFRLQGYGPVQRTDQPVAGVRGSRLRAGVPIPGDGVHARTFGC